MSTKLPANQKIVSIENNKEKPLIIVDGVQWPAALDMDIIEASKINTVSVYKNKEAIDRYGIKGKKGVISVETKKKAISKTLVEMAAASVYFYKEFDSYDEKAVKKNFTPGSDHVLAQLHDELVVVTEWKGEVVHQILVNLAETLGLNLG